MGVNWGTFSSVLGIIAIALSILSGIPADRTSTGFWVLFSFGIALVIGAVIFGVTGIIKKRKEKREMNFSILGIIMSLIALKILIDSITIISST